MWQLKNGYLENFDDWSNEFALAQAQADGLELTPSHWELINFLRGYYVEFEMAPPMRLLTKAVAMRLGAEKGTSLYLYSLFPDGPAKQACRYAGMPKPVSCI
jgi:TusE/DsrC/DsvC family sulfur relay protein